MAPDVPSAGDGLNGPPRESEGRVTAERRNLEGLLPAGSQSALLELIRYGALFRSRWMMIAGVTLAVALGVGIKTKYFDTKWYRAQAVVTPVSPGETLISASGGGLFDSLGAASGGYAFFGGGDNLITAQRYIAIMNSYDFTTALIKRYKLEVGENKKAKLSAWDQYSAINGSFQADYDYKTANMHLYYMDPDPAKAKTMLGNYLAELRDRLRSAEIQSATAAAKSLQEEVNKTSDALLQNQLYELMARQIQRAKVAQVEADFAFKVIEPPVVSERYYSPSARRAAVLWGGITLVLLCSWVVAVDLVRRARRTLEMMDRASVTEVASQSEMTAEGEAERREKVPPAARGG